MQTWISRRYSIQNNDITQSFAIIYAGFFVGFFVWKTRNYECDIFYIFFYSQCHSHANCINKIWFIKQITYNIGKRLTK
jgi:hypothetical protein